MRWLLSVAALLVAVLVAVAALPWWLGALLPSVAGRYGLSFAAYRREGYGRFVLQNVRYVRDGVVVTVDSVEMSTPASRLWSRAVRHPDWIRAGRWSVEVGKRSNTPPPSPTGWMPLRGRLLRIADLLEKWVPEATAGEGVVRWPGGEMNIGSATWSHRELAVRNLRFRNFVASGLVAFPSDSNVVRLSLMTPDRDGAVRLQSDASQISGELSWWRQSAKVSSTFGAQGWRPADANISVAQFDIPADRLKLSPDYGRVTGHAEIAWRAKRLLAELALHAVPLPGSPRPPIDVTSHATSDVDTLTIQTLHATVPGALVDLSAPVTMDRSGHIKGTAARFILRADLARQPWTAAKGLVTGQAIVDTAPGLAQPVLKFDFGGVGLSIGTFNAATAQVAGTFAWPNVEITSLTATGDAGDAIRARAHWDLQTNDLLDAVVRGNVRRDSLGHFLPSAFGFREISFDVQAHGALRNLQHHGVLQVSAVRFGVVEAERTSVEWSGQSLRIDKFGAKTRVRNADITAAGSATSSELTLTELRFAPTATTKLELSEPAVIRWRPALSIEGVHLKGPDASVDCSVAWGDSGRIQLALHGIRSGWITAVFPLRGPEWELSSLAVTGSWAKSPLVGSAAGQLLVDIGGGRNATITCAMHSDAEALWLDSLHGLENGHPVINASGRFPLRLRPDKQLMLGIDPQGSVAIDAATVPNAAFWEQLAGLTGIGFVGPEVAAHVTGTWSRPQGAVLFRSAHASMDPARFPRPLPTVDGLDVAVAGDSEGIRLDRFSFYVEHQLVRASGRLPVTSDTWRDLVRNPVTYLQNGARARLEVPDAQVAMFSRFLPAALAPAGRLQADVRIDRGRFAGYLRIRDAASRPLGPLGVLQQVNAEVEFSDHAVNLTRVTATSGGQPITVSGTVGLPSGAWRAAGGPIYAVALTGQNIPFVRQAGLLIRGDLDLKLRSTASGGTSISGKVVLRDSLFLTDVRAFLPHGGAASPARRPPYFSIDTQPLDAWLLDVDVSGSRFMRVRTPVLTGVVSSRFHLGGTLGEPRAIGDAVIDDGQALMPFAVFDVKQGSVRLTEESPYEPNVYLRGTGRHYGYDLMMEVSGKASAPNITFTSSPALDSEQVLLMVMTGAAPTNDVTTSLTHRAVQVGAFFGQSLFGSVTGAGAAPDRLSIESGEKISRQGKETYDIEYRLNRRWTLTGEYDEFDEYNVGLKWRVAPRNSPR